MLIGDAAYWVSRFTSIDERLLKRIIYIWPKCLAVMPPSPNEDDITLNLKSTLTKDEEARRIFYYLEYQFEPEGFTDDGLAFSKGKIDLAVMLDQSSSRYLAYECKRLNVSYNGARKSLATLYVAEGVKRFITEQYAEGLPVGCMLGYVLDGDIDFARTSVKKAIEDSSEIGLYKGPEEVESIQDIKRFTTHHKRTATNSDIQLRHSFLPFPDIKQQRTKKAN